MSVSGGLYPPPFFPPASCISRASLRESFLRSLCRDIIPTRLCRLVCLFPADCIYRLFFVPFSRIFARALSSFITSGFYPDTALPSCMSVSGGLYPSPFFRPFLAHLCASPFFVHCVGILSRHGSAVFQLSTFISLYICTYTYVYRLPYPFSPSFSPARYA